MSIKKLFGVSDSERNYLSNKDEKEAFNEDIESSRNLQQITRKQEQNIPHVDYGDPKNFARFGSAYLYYESAMNRIIDYYPYDGSDAEINKFHNQSLNIEKYILDNLYPKTNGYININVAGYGSDTPDLDGTSGYGAPQTAYREYIDFFAGPNTGSGGTTVQQLMPDPKSSKIQSSNIYDEDIYRDAGLPSDYGSGTRTSNLRANFDDGVTVEFWLKTGSLGFGGDILSDKQVVFDMHNTNEIAEADYGRLRIALTSSTAADASGTPFLITVRSGSSGFIDSAIGQNLDSGQLQEWNHYAISFQQSGSYLVSKLYINGGLNDTRLWGGTLGELHPKNMFGRIGALASETTTGGKAGSGKLSGSMDEFRFWKVARNGQQIGRYWFTPVHGGVNTDIANTTLGMYYKFNEGITGDHSIDSTVLDYGGRICNGSWTGYTSDSRNINSAIVEAGAASTETKDPIIYAANPAVSDLKTGLLESGSYHDANNNASFLSLVPGWILDEQDTNETSDLSNIAHIAGAYFDKLYLQMSELPTLRHQNYVSASHKPYTYAKHLPQSLGLYTPDLFIDSKVLEQFANRTDTELFEGNLNEVKNLIYINLYNNLADIFKSKGTEKSIKNVFRCFNIDDKILRVSIESNNNEYVLRNNLRQTLTNKNCLNLNHKDNVGGVVYSSKRVAETPAGSGYLHSSSLKVGDTYKNEDKYGFTAETNVIFPHFMKSYDKLDRSFKKVSLYGMNMVNTGSTGSKHGTDTTTLAYDKANFQVYAIRDDHNSRNVSFKLTSSLGPGFGVELTSSTFLNVYNNELWNLSVRLKPARYPFAGFISGAAPTNDNYDLVFSGINTVSTAIANSFTVTASIDSQIARNFLGAAKRLYVGARRTNVTGAIESKSDVLISSTKCWLRYLEDDDLLQHTLDPENAGISGSYQNLSALSWYDTNAEMTKNETLALNWNFLALTGSTTTPGTFNVQDFSSGSTTNRTETGWLGYIIGYQNTGRGYGFGSTNIDQKEFNAHKFINPEQAVSSDMVQVFSDTDELFPNLKKEEIIPNFVYSIEKSLYNAVSEEMLDFFAGAIDFHNIIGSPINRYRGRYKDMEKLRESFFRRVTSLSTVEKYISYYRWFDDALTDIVSQLVPASAEFHDGVLNVIESHVLERNKYRSKFPTLDFVIDDLDAEMVGVSERVYPWFYGSSPPPSSPRPTTVREKFWQERALPSADEISASFSDGTAATHVNSQRLKFKDVIYSTPHVSKSTPLVSLADGTKYPHPSLNRNRFGTPYNFTVSTGNEILKASFHAGTNYSPTKNIQFAPSTFRGMGHVSQENNTFIPLNVLLAKAEDIVPIRDFKEENIPNDYREKKHRRFKVMYGPDFQSGLTYLNTNTRHAFPFNIMSSTVETGYNINVVRDFMPGVEITNRHPEGWGEENNVGMQGPFTYHNVGGKQVRHIPVNRGTDNWMNRPESDKLLLGCLDCTENGAIGLTDPFYPFPEANDIGVPAYPLSASQPALYYRDFVAQSPVNIKNIKVIAGTHELGNFNYNHEVVSTVGAYANPRQFIENQPELPAQSFQQNAMSATNIRGFWDIHRGTEGHFTWVSDYSTDYLNKTANQTVFSNRYSMPGGIDQQTLGYNDFRSAEYSVYNAVPYRNWSVLKPSQGPSGTLSQPVGSSPSEMRVYDIHGLDYGLWSHEARHTARFGRDSLQVTGTSAATNGPGASYDQPPGWHKINRNNKQRMIGCGEETTSYNLNTGIENARGLQFGSGSYVVAEKNGKLYHSGSFTKNGSAITTTTWTVSTWLRLRTPLGTGNSLALVTLGDNGANTNQDQALAVYVESDERVSLWITDTGNNKGKWKSSTILATDTWYHVAVTYDGAAASNEPSFYINGVLEATSSGGAYPTTPQAAMASVNSMGGGKSYIGGTNRGNTTKFKQSKNIDLDEMAIYDAVLTSEEINTVYSNAGILNLTGTIAPKTDNLVTWMRFGDSLSPSDPTLLSEISSITAGWGAKFYDQMGNNDYEIRGDATTNANSLLYFISASSPGGNPVEIAYVSASRTTELVCANQLYDNFFLTHQIPRADRQYSWIGDSVPNSHLIRYNGFQRTDLNRLSPYLSASDGLSYFYNFLNQSDVVVGADDIAFSGGTQPLNVLNTLTLDSVTGAVSDAATNTLGYPLSSNTTNYLNTALNPNIRSADYLNLLLTKRGNKFWTWKQSRIESHPVLRNEREFNTITALSRSGQALLEGYRLPPVSLKGRPQYINFNSPGLSIKKPHNNATLKVTHQNDNIFFNENTLNNITKMKTCVTPFDQILAVNRGAFWDTRFVIYNQNVFPSMKNEFAAWSTGNDRTATYKNNVWNSDPDRRITLGEEYSAISVGGVTVSQSSWCLDPPGGTSPFDQNYSGRINFLNRGSPMEINSNNETTLKYGGYGGSLQNAKFSYMVGTAVDGTAVSEKFRRMRSLTPGPLGWAKHMISSPTSVVKMGCQDIPATGSRSGTFDPAEQIEIYGGEASWQSDTPNNAGIVVYNSTTQQAEFQLSASAPWFNTYEEYWQDLKLMAKGYSVLPEFRISDHVEDYLSFGVNNKGLTNWLGFPGVDPLKDPKGAASIDSSKSNFYQTYTNSDFLKGFLEISQKQLLDAKEIRLTCDAAIRYRPDPSFYPAQRATDLVAQFSKSYGDKITGYFRGEKMSGTALFEENGGCLRPLYEALYSPGILFNSLKAGVACNYPIITDNTQISGTWFGPDLSNAPTPQTNNWALTPSNILDRSDYANTPAGRAKYPQQGFLGNSPFLKLPFETILEPAKYLDGISFYDMQPHPSGTLINQYYSNAANPYEGAQTIFGASADEESYTLFARNFLGEIPNIFLKDGTFSSLKSNVVPKDLTFSSTTEGQAGGGYFMRIKIVPPSNGKLGRENEVGSDGTNDAWGRFGAKYWDNAGVEGNTTTYGFGSGEFNVPQWPMYNPDFKRTQTMCTRPTAYSSIAVAGRASGIWATGDKIGGNKSVPDSFVGCNPLYTPPHADGEAWIDCWFYPSASDGKITEKYDLERILAETKIRTWRFDAGAVTGSGAGPCLITASTAAPKYYDGNMINQVSMQLSATLNYFGVERVYKEERDQNNLVKSKTNETVGSRMVISPKFETPTFNFSDQGIRPISVTAGTLTLPHYASATVNRGIWQQFGAYPTSQQEYPKISIDAPGDSAGGVTQWLKYHYKVVNESSIYNNYDPENANKVATSTKSLAKLLGFDRNNRQMNLGELAENFTLKEAVVAVPYVVRGAASGSTLDNCAPERRASKKFINIPKTRVQAALKENVGTKAGNSLKEAGMSIRTLADRMEEFVLPPQLDWVHNPNIEPLVMYIFPFEYELDKDDLSYIYQNLAPRDSRKVRMKKTAVAHNLLNQELLSSQNILTTEQLRWMVFKVKQRAKSDYYDHIPDQANVAPSERRDIGAPNLDSGPFKPHIREYPIQYNWPYDYISLVEMARLDVEVLFRPGTQAQQENKRKIENKEQQKANRDKKRTRKMSSRIGARKKGKGGKY